MSIIGEPSRFAIEFELLQHYDGVWLFGKVCFWICNQRVGDYNLGTSLRDFLFQIEQGRCDHGQRMSTRFENMPAKEVIELIDNALFGDNSSQYEEVAVNEQWARHNIVPAIDVFDNWKVYLIETKTVARIIFCSSEELSDVHECLLTPGECDNVFIKIYQELDRLHNKELSEL